MEDRIVAAINEMAEVLDVAQLRKLQEVLLKQSIGGVIKYIKLGNLTDAMILR